MRVNTFPQFLLPQPRINDATTSHCIRFRWSKTVHALVVFHSLEEVRQLIVGFDWKYHHEAEKGNTLTDEEKIEYGYMKELYKTVTEAQLATSAAAVVGGGQKEEDDEEDDETRQQALTQVLAGITGPACPTVNLQHVDVHPDIKALLEKSYRLFLGRGMHLLDDRVYVRQALEQQLEGPFQTLIKDVYVFAPSRLLQGRIELVDTPGLNDGDAVRTHCIVQQLKSTDHIVLCAKKSLKTDEKTLDVLQEQKVWERLFQDNLRPGRGDLRLSVLLLPEAVAQLSGKEMIKSDTRKREQQESITENLMTLRERLLMAARALFTDVPEQKVAEYLGGWRIEVVSCYPLLYLSTMVNASFLWEEPSARNTLLDRTDGKKLVALLVSPNRGHLKDIEALHARATRRLECLEERNGAQGPLPEPVLNLAKRLTGGGDGATLRDNRLQEIKTAIVEDDAFKFAKGLLQPDPPAAGVAQTLDETLPGGVAKAKAWLLEVMEKKGNGRRKSPLRNFVNRCSPSLVQTILGHESQAIAEAKQQLSEQMVTARDDLLACSTTTLQHHLEQCFANCIDLESPDGARCVALYMHASWTVYCRVRVHGWMDGWMRDLAPSSSSHIVLTHMHVTHLPNKQAQEPRQVLRPGLAQAQRAHAGALPALHRGRAGQDDQGASGCEGEVILSSGPSRDRRDLRRRGNQAGPDGVRLLLHR